MSDEFELSVRQRLALFTFIGRVQATLGSDENLSSPRDDWTDAALIATALRAGLLLGHDTAGLEALFRREFGLAVVTGGILGDMLSAAMLAGLEDQLRAAGGGKN